LARNGLATTLWGHDAEHTRALARQGCNPYYLPGVDFPPLLQVTSDLKASLGPSRDVIVVVPSHAFRSVLEQAAPCLRPDARVAWGTKGLEPDTGRLLHEVAAEALGAERSTAVISGPTFAREVVAGLPAATTVASRSAEFAGALAEALHSSTFRVYTSTDVIGVQLGGAIKNVLAIAAGIADGLGFGANSRAALLTRGLAEMVRLGVAMGGRAETFMGLAGIGDLVLTATDDQSRNRRFGIAVGRGQGTQAAEASIGQVVEGVRTTAEVHRIAARVGVDVPITEQVYAVLYRGRAPRDAVNALLSRQQKPEAG
jgi:glycerol-3-phosphate dehydrogenase (NAD(P)+)